MVKLPVICLNQNKDEELLASTRIIYMSVWGGVDGTECALKNTIRPGLDLLLLLYTWALFVRTILLWDRFDTKTPVINCVCEKFNNTYFF